MTTARGPGPATIARGPERAAAVFSLAHVVENLTSYAVVGGILRDHLH